MCTSVASLKLYLFTAFTVLNAHNRGRGAATPSPRSTDAVGGDGAAGVDAARGVAAAAVVAGGSELGDDVSGSQRKGEREWTKMKE